jgi:hypothetical protein
MATRPAQDFTWGGTQVDPGEPKKAAGFDDGEEPPAGWINYLLALIAGWLAYLIDRGDTAATDRRKVVLSSRVVLSGTWTVGISAGTGKLTETSVSACEIFLDLPVGWILSSYRVRCQHSATGAIVNMNCRIQRQVDGTVTYQSTVQGALTNTTAAQEIGESNLAHTVTEGRYSLLLFGNNAGANTMTVWDADWTCVNPLS